MMSSPLLAGVAAFVVPLAAPPESADARVEYRIGQIFIIGNTETPQHILLDLLELYPGTKVSLADLRKAESRLCRWRVWGKVEITVLPPDRATSEFHDIRVDIEEQEWNWLLFGVGYDLLRYRLTGDRDYLVSGLQRLNDKIWEWVVGPSQADADAREAVNRALLRMTRPRLLSPQ
jgi:hypothetical protein